MKKQIAIFIFIAMFNYVQTMDNTTNSSCMSVALTTDSHYRIKNYILATMPLNLFNSQAVENGKVEMKTIPTITDLKQKYHATLTWTNPNGECTKFQTFIDDLIAESCLKCDN